MSRRSRAIVAGIGAVLSFVLVAGAIGATAQGIDFLAGVGAGLAALVGAAAFLGALVGVLTWIERGR